MVKIKYPSYTGCESFSERYPDNIIESMTNNAVHEVTDVLDKVLNHYSTFLRDNDFENGRDQMFKPENLYCLQLLQIEITRLAWLRSKYCDFNSPEAIMFWKMHKMEEHILKQLGCKDLC